MTESNELERVVVFRLGEELLAASIGQVERVLPYTRAHPVPHMPEWMDGILEYQGEVIPVVDLRRRFGRGDHASSSDAPRRLLVLTTGEQLVAAVVDQVLDVRPISAADLLPPPEMTRSAGRELVRGVLRRDATLVLVLDVARIFTPSERELLEGATRDGVRG